MNTEKAKPKHIMACEALVGQEVGNRKVLRNGLYILQPIFGTDMCTLCLQVLLMIILRMVYLTTGVKCKMFWIQRHDNNFVML